jgi:hypothetical protein
MANSKSNIQTMSTKMIHNLLKKYNRLQGHSSVPVEFMKKLEEELKRRQLLQQQQEP